MDKTKFNEVIALSEIISNTRDIDSLKHIYKQTGDYKHPQILYDLGISFFVMGDKIQARNLLLKGAEYGLTFNSDFYDNLFSNSIGSCFSLLLQEYSIKSNDFQFSIKLTSLGYLYLSRCIELYPRQAQDSYKTRGMLFRQHKNPMTILRLLMDNMGPGVNSEPFIISDYYFAAMASGSVYGNLLNSASEIHRNLGEMTIGGKDADDYTLVKIAELGEKRHEILFKTMEPKFKSGAFDVSKSQFSTLFNS